MTTLQMRAKKADLISTIINDVNNQDELETVSLLLKEIIFGEKQAPCRYSVVELNERAQQAVLDYEKERNLIPHSQISRKNFIG